MKITDVKVSVVEGNFDWGIVKVETDSGVTGFGESFTARYSREVKSIILSAKEVLVGEDPMDVERLIRKVFHAVSYVGGLVTKAVSGIEIALWDICGKALNVPIYRLLGGKFRNRVKVYVDCHAGHPITIAPEDYEVVGREESYTPEAYAEHAKRVKGLGFDFLKFDLYPDIARLAHPHQGYEGHLTNAQLKYLSSLVEAVRDAVGENVEIAVDFGGYTTKDAIRLANSLEPYNLAWVEDVVPFNAQNIDALIEVTKSIKTPTLTGELIHTIHGFKEVIVKQAVRVIAPDLGVVGGISQAKKVADLAEAYYIPVAPHNIASPVGTIAACHFCASIPNFIALEFHSIGVPWWSEMIRGGRLIEDGYVNLPSKPGLGIDLNLEVINEHLKRGEEPL